MELDWKRCGRCAPHAKFIGVDYLIIGRDLMGMIMVVVVSYEMDALRRRSVSWILLQAE